MEALRSARPATPGLRVRPTRLRTWAEWQFVALVASIALVAQLLARASGVAVRSADLHQATGGTTWQLLSAELLKQHLSSSLMNLPSQPPLFNLATAVLLRLPGSLAAVVIQVSSIAMAVCIAVATARILRSGGLGRLLTLVLVVVFVAADPAQLLYPGWYFYATATAALATAAAMFGFDLAKDRSLRSACCFVTVLALLALTNSSFQPIFVALAALPLLWQLRRARRILLIATVPAILIVGAWQANDVLRFNSWTTSDWGGMNLYKSTLWLAPKADRATMVARGELPPIALIPGFSPLSRYGPLGTSPHRGVPALDRPFNGVRPNYNNAAYLEISRRYLTADLRYIEHRPAAYLDHLTIGARLAALPAEEYVKIIRLPAFALGGYTLAYEHFIDLQPRPNYFAAPVVAVTGRGPSLSALSLTVTLELLLFIFATPIAIWFARRNRAFAVPLLSLWLLGIMPFATSILAEVGENNRFRYELGTLPFCAAVLSVTVFVRLLRGQPAGPERRGATGDG